MGRSLVDRIFEPQRKRIRFGLVKPNLVVANLQERAKPVTFLEATSVCKGEAARGGWERRKEKDRPRNLGDPFGWVKTQLCLRTHKAARVHSEVGRVHSSEEGSNDPGVKGRGRGLATNESRRSA